MVCLLRALRREVDAELVAKLRSVQDSLNKEDFCRLLPSDVERREVIKQRIKRVFVAKVFYLGIGARGDEGRRVDESAAATAIGEFAKAL